MYSVGREFMVNIKQSKRVSSPRDMTTKKGSRLDKIAFGFVRQSEKLLDSNMFVPEPLTRLCMQFATEEEHAYFGIYDVCHIHSLSVITLPPPFIPQQTPFIQFCCLSVDSGITLKHRVSTIETKVFLEIMQKQTS